ncbi:hypothetical protein [Streptomyces subrutilus]|uniref:ATP-binding protein n=1 Tax=Streptomyces subrutilus TaxID=36818 RepID=A0A1E5NXP7_9ACTN|nr:hypothetical protein [Streptomyces subrutilus]OEJ21020.1 hypothetical protein BGK67_34555 [Streptomyces subrutilus]
MDSAIDFTIGPEVTSVQAMAQATAMIRMTLPMFLSDVPEQAEVCRAVESVVTELVDVTARHKAGVDLVGRVAFDGTHVTVSVGDIKGALPAPEQEPGLYLVHRLADEVGQYAGDFGGRVTWAAVPARR